MSIGNEELLPRVVAKMRTDNEEDIRCDRCIQLNSNFVVPHEEHTA